MTLHRPCIGTKATYLSVIKGARKCCIEISFYVESLTSHYASKPCKFYQGLDKYD